MGEASQGAHDLRPEGPSERELLGTGLSVGCGSQRRLWVSVWAAGLSVGCGSQRGLGASASAHNEGPGRSSQGRRQPQSSRISLNLRGFSAR